MVGAMRRGAAPLTPDADVVKKISRMLITFVLLSVVYLGYSRGFALMAGLVATKRSVPILPVLTDVSKSSRETADLAVLAFGPGHWTTRAPMRYYDVQRGYWIFWQEQTRMAEGKTWEFSPMAIITRSKKNGPLKTITADKARVDFNVPFDASVPGGEPARIIHALMRENVRIRDDKGTPDIADDLTTDPMKSLEYDEAKEHIIGLPDERVVLRDRGLTASGDGLVMELLRKQFAPIAEGEAPRASGPAAGFDGVKAIIFRRNPEIDIQDVGRSGIVPGGSGKPAQVVMTTDKAGQKVTKAAPRPGHIQATGEMRIDLPKPRLSTRASFVGPPAPPEPTIATFHQNVRVRQGDPQTPEQLDCDHLVATMMPGEKVLTGKAKAEAEDAAKARRLARADGTLAVAKEATKGQDDPAAEPPDAGPLSGLVLHRAVAKGHAVWLQSTANGMRALGNELRYTRCAPDPDQIFLLADRQTEIVKTDFHTTGKDKGKPQSISTILTKDVTIYQYPAGTRPPSVIARGPGTLETRAAGREEVERFASWQDSLTMVSAEGSEQRRVTLTGHPRIRSASQGDISADRSIVADLFPKAKAPVILADGKPVPAATGDALRITKLVADGDVHLVTPETPANPTANPPREASPGRQIIARNTLTAHFREATEGQIPKKPPASSPIAAQPDLVAALPQDPAAKPKMVAPAKPPEPAMNAIADQVVALVLQQEGSDKGQVQDATLAGHVEIHQDPAKGKTQGTDITADSVRLQNKGVNRVLVYANGTPANPAIAKTDGRKIVGPVLVLDQSTDHAWVRGTGRLETEQADTDFLDDSAPIVADANSDKKTARPAKKKGPLIITWGAKPDDPEAWMNFFGRPDDYGDGVPESAYAFFHSNVHANTDESSLQADQLKATFDGPIAFVKAKETETPRSGEKTPGPQIARLHALGHVDITARKYDPETGFLKDKKRIIHNEVTYEKATGQFFTGKDGPGEVYLYTTSKDENPQAPTAALAANPRAIRPVTARIPADRAAGKTPEPPQLSLTHVSFSKKMQGRFTPPHDGKPQDYSTATFLGSVEAVMAKVPDENVEIDADRLPPDFYRIVSQKLNVLVEPPQSQAEKASDRVLLDASGGAKAFTPKQAIDGDRITYDSMKELSYVYGGPSGVMIVNQDGAGQPYTAGRGSSVFHNHKTGQTQLIDPQTFQIIDPSSGIRSRLATTTPPPMSLRNVGGLAAPKPLNLKNNPNDPAQQAKKMRLPSQGDKDRRSFSGK